MKVTTIGIDLAKDVFQLHGVDRHGKTVFNKALKRGKFLAFFANLAPCLIGMEACTGAHHWARLLVQMGHDVRLMAPQFVKPYVKGNKHDAADAEASCEAVQRPNMRFVPIKTIEQQAILSVHRAREGFVRARTAQANQIRGLLSEYGLVLPKGIGYVRKSVPALLEQHAHLLPGCFAHLIASLLENLKHLDEQTKHLEGQIERWHRASEQSKGLAQLPGIGPITATALLASMGDAGQFANGRQASAWVGIVPAQHSSGGKQRLLGISKRGDKYLRTLLVHGARAVLAAARRNPHKHRWLISLEQRRGANVAALAQANKTMRVVWALLAHGRRYQANYRAPEPQVA